MSSHFYPREKIFQRSLFFLLPSLSRNHVSRLSESGVSEYGDDLFLACMRESSQSPYYLTAPSWNSLGICKGCPSASSTCIFWWDLAFKPRRHMCPLKDTSSLAYSLLWIISFVLHHNLSPVENVDSVVKCECCLHAPIWQSFNLGFNCLSSNR